MNSRRPGTLKDFAERWIRTAIANGRVEPGSRLLPDALGAEMGLSHIPVREALASLVAVGYVDHRPGRGYAARVLSSEDLQDIYHWRQVLETEAFRLAVPRMTDTVDEIAALVHTMAGLTKEEDRLEFVDLNRTFHFAMFERAGSPQLVRLLNSLWDTAAPYASLVLTSSEAGQAEHEAMLPLLAARDAEGLAAAMDAHRGRRVGIVRDWERSEES